MRRGRLATAYIGALTCQACGDAMHVCRDGRRVACSKIGCKAFGRKFERPYVVLREAR